MRKHSRHNTPLPLLHLLLSAVLLVVWLSAGACSLFSRRQPAPSVPDKPDAAAQADVVAPQVNAFAHDMTDIPIPDDLEWQRADSLLITSDSFRGGILRYTSTAGIQSLRNYMVAAMTDNEWRLAGETAADKVLLAFIKPNKTCLISLSESWLKRSQLDLYITIDNSASGAASR